MPNELPTITAPDPVTVAAKPAVPAATFPALFLQKLEITAPSPSSPWPMRTTQAPYDPATGTLADPKDAPPTTFSTPDVKVDATTYPAFGQWIGAGLTIAGPFQVAKGLAMQWAKAASDNKRATAALAAAQRNLAMAQAANGNPTQSQAITMAQAAITTQTALVTSTQATIDSASKAWASAAAALGALANSTPPEVTAALAGIK